MRRPVVFRGGGGGGNSRDTEVATPPLSVSVFIITVCTLMFLFSITMKLFRDVYQMGLTVDKT